MDIPESAIQALNSLFDQEGASHEISIDGVWVDTGCIEWISTVIEPSSNGIPQPSTELKTASDNIEKQIKQSGENFDRKNGSWNIKKYYARFTELMQQQPEHIQKANDEYVAEFLAYSKQMENATKSITDFFDEAKVLVQNESVLLYMNSIEWDGIAPNGIVLAGITDQYDILRIEKTHAGNYGFLTEDIIAKLKILDGKFGIEIIGACMDAVEFVLKRIPKGTEAKELGKWLLDFCPDLYEAPKKFPKGKVSLWWD